MIGKPIYANKEYEMKTSECGTVHQFQVSHFAFSMKQSWHFANTFVFLSNHLPTKYYTYKFWQYFYCDGGRTLSEIGSLPIKYQRHFCYKMSAKGHRLQQA